jgi:hypothetical protein
MDQQTSQAFAEFKRFLRGQAAPALVGHALATVVRQDMRAIVDAVLREAYAMRGVDLMEALLAVRAKVYEIFFFRVVRFRRVYDFFPRFERAVVAAAPGADRDRIAELFRKNPWQEIKPIGTFRDPRELALGSRSRAEVDPNAFNEKLYRNATHEILSADKRYTFDDAELRDEVAGYQEQVTEVFDDFVSLIKDALLRREIMLSNVADRNLTYTDKPRFQVEFYLGQLSDLAIALLNDDFLEHSVQIFGIIRALADSSGIDIGRLDKIHAKSRLVNRQKLADYCATRTGPLLLRTILPFFPLWRPEPLLEQLAREEERSARELALTLVKAYGRDGYPQVVDALERCDPAAPQHYRRNLVYLLGTVPTDHGPLKARAVQALALNLKRDGSHQINLEVVEALGSIRAEAAVDALVAKLAQLEPDFNRAPELTDVCHRIVDTLVETHVDRALRAAVEFCERHNVLDRHHEALSRVTLPEPIRHSLEAEIRREMRKMRMSFSLLGDSYAVRSRLLALGSATQPDVAELCDEIAASFPPSHELVAAVEQLRNTPTPPPPLAYDRAFHELLVERNLPEALAYAFEAGSSGKLELQTRGRIECSIWLRKGEVWHAAVPALFTQEDDAFFWIFALEKQAIAAIRFDPSKPLNDARTLRASTPDLIREGLFRAKHVQQTIGGILSPESRFRRKDEAAADDYFARSGNPEQDRAVWVALDGDADVKGIVAATGLSEHEIYRALFDLVRENLIAIEASAPDRQLATVDDALTALGLFLRRIEAHPTYFQSYQSAAEVCSYLANEAEDEALRSAAWALHTYLLNAFTLRRVLTPQSIEFCTRVLNLVGVYLKSGAEVDRRELLDFLDIYLPEENRWPEPPPDENAFIQSILEQIENIDGYNDPFDEVALPPMDGAGAVLDEEMLGLEPVVGQTAEDALASAARSYAKPIKDFAREIERSLASGREVPSEWLELAAPPVELLLVAAERARVPSVRETASGLERAIRQQRQTGSNVLTPAFCRYVLTEYQKLANALPSAFALTATSEEVAALKETLLVKFLLRQVPEVDDEVVNRVLVAGFDRFDELVQTPPETLAGDAGLAPALAEKIFMKVFQYEDLYFRPREPGAHAKFLAFFAICLNVLKEIHASVERMAAIEGPATGDGGGNGGAGGRRQSLLADRQRALWGLFALLCMRDDLDTIERIQKAVFEQRIRMLEDYFQRLSAEPFPTASRRDSAR